MRLLVSVRNGPEAAGAVEAGADLIDLKDPSAGALGALDPASIAEILGEIGGRRPTSATTGDLPPDPDLLCAAAERIAATGVDYVKIGLWPGAGRAAAVSRLGAALSGRTQLIGVLLADADPDFGLIGRMADAGFAGAMLDCAGKGASLPERLGRAGLGRFVAQCRRRGLLAGLAGSLCLKDIPRLAPLRPDILGFRGGLCRDGNRRNPLDPAAVARAAAEIRLAGRTAGSPAAAV
jgi:dihydroneopterin aldolase